MILATIVIVLSLTYTLFTFANSRRPRPALSQPAGDLLFVYVVPCLDEAAVIRATLDRLLDPGRPDVAVLIVDDGSADATADIVRNEYPGRVWLVERRLPDARQGKGEALNTGYRHLLSSGVLAGRDPATVVLGVVDADGRVEPDALDAVAPYFADPQVGAVQIGVRMYNATRNVLTRLQDMEFVVFTEVFQRGREWVGSVGLGGNGQFVRLSALQSLGEAPWTRCLTEDLDLGVRLLAKGWKNRFCPETFVAQEAVPGLRRLFRQRARWFQGHIQSMRLVPLVMRSTAMSGKASFDVIYHLTSPLLVLTTSFVMVSFLASVVYVVAAQIQIREAVLPSGLMIVIGYLLAFGMAPLFGYVYSRREQSYGLARAIALAHLYTAYGFLWFGAGWVGLWRMVWRKHGWSKTARFAVTTPDGSCPGADPGPEVASAPSHCGSEPPSPRSRGRASRSGTGAGRPRGSPARNRQPTP